MITYTVNIREATDEAAYNTTYSATTNSIDIFTDMDCYMMLPQKLIPISDNTSTAVENAINDILNITP